LHIVDYMNKSQITINQYEDDAKEPDVRYNNFVNDEMSVSESFNFDDRSSKSFRIDKTSK